MKCSCTSTPGTPCKSCGCINNPGGPGLRANGEACGNTKIPGTFKCHMHGGSTPAARMKAENALALLRLPSIEALHEVLELQLNIIRRYEENTCPTCNYPKGDTDEIHAISKVCSVIVRQAQAIMDRTGLPARAEIAIKQSDGDLDLKLLTTEERSDMIAVLARLKELKEQIRQRIHGTVTAPTTNTVQ